MICNLWHETWEHCEQWRLKVCNTNWISGALLLLGWCLVRLIMLRWFIFGYCCMISIIMSWCLFLRLCRIVRHNCINLCETSKNWFWAITLMICAGFRSSIRVIEARKWLSFHLGQAKLNHLLLHCILCNLDLCSHFSVRLFYTVANFSFRLLLLISERSILYVVLVCDAVDTETVAVRSM